ncbi:MAG: hypothetical protein KC912_21485 [Proteobacteria bacterium]|nr:hypothetical protein [Pseudomonadota bacterium]
MAKSRRPAPEALAAPQNRAAVAEGPATSNALLVSLLEAAAADVGLDDNSLLALSDTPSTDTAPSWAREDRDTLPTVRDKHADANYAKVENASAFVQGEGDEHVASPNDVAQGALGDCYFLAALIALARANPAKIMELITDNGDGTYDVTLYLREDYESEAKPTVITVDAQLPMQDGSPVYAGLADQSEEGTEMWPALMEKAFAQLKGSYELIGGSEVNTEFEYFGAMDLLIGNDTDSGSVENVLAEDDPERAMGPIAQALEDGLPVVANSADFESDEKLAREAAEVNVFGNHAYAPAAVDLDAQTIDLTNPWGSSHVVGLPAAEFKRFFASVRYGT